MTRATSEIRGMLKLRQSPETLKPPLSLPSKEMMSLVREASDFVAIPSVYQTARILEEVGSLYSEILSRGWEEIIPSRMSPFENGHNLSNPCFLLYLTVNSRVSQNVFVPFRRYTPYIFIYI